MTGIVEKVLETPSASLAGRYRGPCLAALLACVLVLPAAADDLLFTRVERGASAGEWIVDLAGTAGGSLGQIEIRADGAAVE
ncbi:MAG: hypothetical protein KDD11_20865, partial [Acidobacteria bacterium]|nr:hypothetical protein [Acidobacteriota bacterium]